MTLFAHPVLGHSARAIRLAGLLFLLATSAFSLETRFAEGEMSNVTVPSDETVDDTLLAGADTIEIHGVVTGNLLAFARHVIVDGTVQGDLVTGAQRVEVRGSVGGNLLTFSQQADIAGQTSQSLYAFGQSLGLDSSARVGGDMIAFGAEVTAEGAVARDLYTFAGTTEARGEVGGDLIARTGRLSVSSPARVEGDLRAHVRSNEQVAVEPGTVVGATEIILPEPEETRSRFLTPGFYLWQLFRLGAAFVTGLVLFWLFPAWFAPRIETLSAALLTMGAGFLVLVVTPLAAVFVALTIVGLPVALFTFVLWLAALYAAMIVAGAWLGQTLLHTRPRNLKTFALPLLAGLAILVALTAAPYLGFLVRLLVVLCGLGLLARVLQDSRVLRQGAP